MLLYQHSDVLTRFENVMKEVKSVKSDLSENQKGISLIEKWQSDTKQFLSGVETKVIFASV